MGFGASRRLRELILKLSAAVVIALCSKNTEPAGPSGSARA